VRGQASAARPHGSPVWKAFWKLPIPHKVLIFGWRVANDGLATEVNKKIRKLPVSGTCSICGREEESVMHALIRCPHALHLRAAMRQGCQVLVLTAHLLGLARPD
jgi:Zn finger protein HypA/HybF involved in hydrogenase expression